MLIDEQLTIKVMPQNIDHFISCGYNCKCGDFLSIKTSELSQTSKKKEKRVCDHCGKTYIRQHNYNYITLQSYGIDVCPECLNSTEFKKNRRKKVEETNLKKYGVKAPLQNKNIQNKQKNTMKERYGVEFPALSQSILDKIKNTNMNKYGGNTPMSDPSIVAKVRETLSQNGTVPTSSQQLEIVKLLKIIYGEEVDIILNYPESNVSLDISFCYAGQKIDIEYDGWYWHQDEQKDRRRDEFIKSQGYKILRIKSGHLLPSIESLQEAINELVFFNKDYQAIILSDWK